MFRPTFRAVIRDLHSLFTSGGYKESPRQPASQTAAVSVKTGNLGHTTVESQISSHILSHTYTSHGVNPKKSSLDREKGKQKKSCCSNSANCLARCVTIVKTFVTRVFGNMAFKNVTRGSNIVSVFCVPRLWVDRGEWHPAEQDRRFGLGDRRLREPGAGPIWRETSHILTAAWQGNGPVGKPLRSVSTIF